MALFLIRRDSALDAVEAWRRLTDWERHADVVPLTRISVVTAPPVGVGTVFVARTGVGAAGFDDPMEITVWRPPGGSAAGLCRLVKRGRTVTGWAEIEVGAGPGGRGSRVVWREDAGVRGLPRAADPVVARAGRLMFGRAVDRLLRD
ncbi:SRPBCC family protein [Streptomyces fructofermentans]|uniref:SRPBCC family protein n=1 Tax=Streptomyces fructofermentans TaxID=152141 RepID=UPI001675BFAE|nr:SRPBCC family protein [Streptomyces fructofermentans]